MSALPHFNPNRSDGARFVETHGGQKTDISIFDQESNPTTRWLANDVRWRDGTPPVDSANYANGGLK